MNAGTKLETVSTFMIDRSKRTSRVYAAWTTSLASKVATLLVQLVSLPAVYRSVGPEQFAAYAAVTSVVSMLGFFNLGFGGAMVSPLARAAARDSQVAEKQILSAALVPLCAVAVAIGAIALPLIGFANMTSLFGEASRAVSAPMLRAAALIACAGTLAAMPLSVCGNARQAYQELHISNTIGTICNTVMFAGLLLVAWLSPTLLSFVALRVLVPLLGQLADVFLLVRKRRYLEHALSAFTFERAKHLAHDGIYFLAAASSYLLIYQWAIYLAARMWPPTQSAPFIICIQIILLATSFVAGVTQPLWGATANAVASKDHAWVRRAVAHVRLLSITYGILALFGCGLFLNLVVRLWMHKAIVFSTADRWLAGCYILLKTWEYCHWTLSLGLSRMRPASRAVLTRAVLFAVTAPLIMQYGSTAVLAALCASILLVTAWYYPLMISRALRVNAD